MRSTTGAKSLPFYFLLSWLILDLILVSITSLDRVCVHIYIVRSLFKHAPGRSIASTRLSMPIPVDFHAIMRKSERICATLALSMVELVPVVA